MKKDINFEEELSKAVFVADQVFVNKELVGNRIMECIAKKRRKSLKRIWMVATSAAAMVVLSAGYFASDVTVKSSDGMLSLVLPDSSAIQMQKHSTLSYNRIVWLWRRSVSFDGEASFVVNKGGDFTVNTALGEIVVLGTEFIVNSNEKILNVQCISGAVEVRTDIGYGVLEAGDKVKRDVDGIIFTKSESPLPTYLRLNYISLGDVIDKIEQIYGVTITIDSGSEDIIYDGVLPTGNLDDALDMVMSSCGLHYTINGTHIEIK